MIQKALRLMTHELGSKTRDDKKTLLSTHCKRVYAILKKYTRNKNQLLAGIMHDMVEDAGWTHARLKKKFGKNVADIVLLLSENPRLPKKDRKKAYIRQISNADTPVQVVKIADMMDNLQDSKQNMPPKYHAALKKYYQRYSFNPKTKKTRIYRKLKSLLL